MIDCIINRRRSLVRAATDQSRRRGHTSFRQNRNRQLAGDDASEAALGEFANKRRGCKANRPRFYARSTGICRAAHKSFRHSFGVIGACCDNGIQREFVMIRRRFYRSPPPFISPHPLASCFHPTARSVLSFSLSCAPPLSLALSCIPLDNNLLRQTRTIQFHRRKITCLRDREINNELVSKMNIPESERRRREEGHDRSSKRIRGIPFSRFIYVSSVGLPLPSRSSSSSSSFASTSSSSSLSLSFSGLPTAISQTSCTPLELSEIGPEEERPCPSSKPKRGGKKTKRKTREARAERRRKVIFRPRRFQSTSFYATRSGSLSLSRSYERPRAFSHAKTFLRRISRKGTSVQIAGTTRFYLAIGVTTIYRQKPVLFRNSSPVKLSHGERETQRERIVIPVTHR